MTTSALAFYKGRGGLVDRAIRLVTRSRYSHVEFVPNVNQVSGHKLTRCLSASWRDRGVREQWINLQSGNWDVIDVPWAPDDVEEFFQRELGGKYDLSGVLFSQVLNLRRHDRNKWFCSEICAAALDFNNPQGFSPGMLASVVQQINLVVARS